MFLSFNRRCFCQCMNVPFFVLCRYWTGILHNFHFISFTTIISSFLSILPTSWFSPESGWFNTSFLGGASRFWVSFSFRSNGLSSRIFSDVYRRLHFMLGMVQNGCQKHFWTIQIGRSPRTCLFIRSSRHPRCRKWQRLIWMFFWR